VNNCDLISREALKSDISEKLCDKFDKWNKTITVSEFETVVIDVIDNAPTVEPERPKNMTNGEKLLSIFDGARIYGSDKKERTIKVCVDMEIINVFDLDWWNAEYKESEEEE
jgi:hypothetical protein